MHVGLFIDGYFPVIDGVVKVTDAYASRLANKCDVTVFAPKGVGDSPEYDARFPYRIVRCKSIMREGDDYPQGFPVIDFKFKNQISKLDLIHLHSAFPVGLCAKAVGRRHNIPMVGTIHSDFRPDVIQYVGKTVGEQVIKLMMSAYNACDECWTVNDAVANMFQRDYGLKRPYRVMPYSTDHYPIVDIPAARQQVNAEYGLNDDDFVMAHVGRQDLQKREDFTLRSLAELKKSIPDFKMLMVGDGNKQEYLKQLAVELGLKDNVIFTGKVSDSLALMTLYTRTDLLLFPSVSDTYGLVKIEAACQKTPTLFCEGTMAAGDTVDNVNGFVAHNDEAAFAARIASLYSDRKLLRKVGQGAFRDLYRTWDNLVDDVYENYIRIIENHNFVKI